MFTVDIKKITEENTNFRNVLHTGEHSQIVVMSIPVNGDIGEEVHQTTDQIIVVVEGEGELFINGEVTPFEEDAIIFIPAGTSHNIINTGDEDLKIFTIYSPPQHKPGEVQKTKNETDVA